MWVLCWSLFWYALLYSFRVCNHLDKEERASCFPFIVFWMSCYCKCPVALRHGAVGLQFVIVAFDDHTHLRLKIYNRGLFKSIYRSRSLSQLVS